MMTTESNIFTRLTLLIAMLLCGCLSVIFGKELCWDLANYHYYNPYALLHARHAIDYWPSSYIHQYINPTIDLLSYFLISQFTPRMSEFILGAIHGINLWLLFLIAQLFLQQRFKLTLAFLLALFGLCGPTVLPGLGSFQNDNLISIFVLGSILLQLQALKTYQTTSSLPILYLIISGLALGLGFGLKLTAGIYIAGTILTTIILPIASKQKIKILFFWGTSAAIGMLITNGYWMYVMWHEHHNPFFPFFNNFFHSPDFPSINWRDKGFLPKTISQMIFFPFYFAWDGRIGEVPFRDFRFPVLYILFVLTGMQWLWNKRTHSVNQASFSLLSFWLFAFFIFSYVVWQYYFSIARYLAPIEMLAPLIIYLLVQHLANNKAICNIVVFGIFYFLLYSFSPTQTVRAPFYDNTFFNISFPESVTHTPNATVLVAYSAFVEGPDPRPQAYLIPFFPSHWRFIGIPLRQEKYAPDKTAIQQIAARLHGDTNKMYLLTSDRNMPELYQAAQQFGLAPHGECEKIFSDRQAVTHQNVLLCPVAHAG